jgi:predicted TIM-barrel fold metal-dependent hydrolase
MNLSDVSVHIGNWPYRRLAATSLPQILEKMERLNIQRAAVCNTNSVLLRNSHRGNTELYEQINNYPEKLYGVATLNPLYVNARQDLEICRNSYGFKALRLLPAYHNYSLDCPEVVEFAKAAGALGMTLIIPHRLVDIRQRHWLDVEVNIELDELVRFSNAIGDLEIIATEFALDESDAYIAMLQAAPSISVGISRIHALWPRALPKLISKLSNRRFFFASGLGFKVGENALLRLAALNEAADINQIGELNFLRIFGTN